ncbi:diaminopropionate ammonia-lyase [Fusobacterium simiae]|uniref:Diaminopropionate ammonia-lyase n=1 Tax=Fusobacterium simiae TaxID=855 RepID=A0ABT4DF49_FUSSI|nr:diaminopropionate ammonia-lyase [Fusobacterium simiae]MCY7007224.1 diaminopropionate ammonia-lyase [Fusobacterium simiae]
MKIIKWVENKKRKNSKGKIFSFDKKSLDNVLKFHKSLPNYEKTPLIDLKELAKYCGVKNIWLKDESKRFGLNAFKVLGASYAIGKYLSEVLNEDISKLPFSVLTSDKIKKKLGNLTFITATDGNHGRGVAWVAKYLQQNSIVYMPKGSSQMRLKAIQNEGADASITDLNYDDAVRLANKKAKENNWIMVQDTAWKGYEKIPLWIMQGYSTIMNEIIEELEKIKEKPTHIFLQAGVGSFAGAMQALLIEKYGLESPISIICEPNGANCIYKSFKEDDGIPHNVTGNLKTIMAGLACGEPNTISWEILKDYSNFALSCDDSISAKGMRVLSSPIAQDKRIISGESGAVGIGAFITLCENQNEYKDLWEKLNINSESRILCISTEGDTDKIGYKNIVWNGWYENN